jgi:cold shock CspA family protein
MAGSRESWNKEDLEKKKEKKRLEKEQKKEQRKAAAKDGKSFEEMIAYVDENGNLSSTPPDPNKKKVIKEEDIEVSTPRKQAMAPEAARTGTVAFFNDSKGYGFIKDAESGDSIFVHLNGLIDKIKENNKVTFEVEMGMKGPNAVRVKLLR